MDGFVFVLRQCGPRAALCVGEALWWCLRPCSAGSHSVCGGGFSPSPSPFVFVLALYSGGRSSQPLDSSGSRIRWIHSEVHKDQVLLPLVLVPQVWRGAAGTTVGSCSLVKLGQEVAPFSEPASSSSHCLHLGTLSPWEVVGVGVGSQLTETS